jgi:phosphoribosylglycinamide formyltransferase 2
MLDGIELDRIVAKHKPDFIVPEMKLFAQTFTKKQELQLSLLQRNFTMNRKLFVI